MAELSDDDKSEIEDFERTGEMSDHLFSRSVVRGIIIGTPLIGIVVFLGLELLPLDTDTQAIVGLALWSALWAGVLLGAVVGVGLRLIRLENKIHGKD